MTECMRFYSREDTEAFDSIVFRFIKTELKGHVFTITLNRPEKRNAFTPAMAEEIVFALAYAHYNSTIRCVILNAIGPVFCAGADLNAFHDLTVRDENKTLPEIREEVRLGDAFADLCKPAIAQVEGSVLAGGFLLICGCTFVISVPAATFSLPEVKRGIWPMQVMASLGKILPPRKVLEMSVTGQSYTAGEALAMGLITQIAEPEEIQGVVGALAAQICENAPYAIQLGIETSHNLSEIPESQQHTYLKEQLKKLLLSEDAKEGTKAFTEKRKPIWKGR